MNFKNISIVNRDNEQNLKLSITSNSTLLKIENSINFVKKNVNSSLTVFIIKYQKLKSIFKKKLKYKKYLEKKHYSSQNLDGCVEPNDLECLLW